MTEYRISGIWRNTSGEIVNYAVHLVLEGGISKASRKTKTQIITMLEINRATIKTWVWNYSLSHFEVGEAVIVVNGEDGKFLQCDPCNDKTLDLKHLINLGWFEKI